MHVFLNVAHGVLVKHKMGALKGHWTHRTRGEKTYRHELFSQSNPGSIIPRTNTYMHIFLNKNKHWLHPEPAVVCLHCSSAVSQGANCLKSRRINPNAFIFPAILQPKRFTLITLRAKYHLSSTLQWETNQQRAMSGISLSSACSPTAAAMFLQNMFTPSAY